MERFLLCFFVPSCAVATYPRKTKNPVFTGVFWFFHWRWEAELNRCKRICSPLPNRSAIPPIK